MVKNIVISLLVAFLVIPHLHNIITLLDFILCFVIISGTTFVLLTDLEEVIRKKALTGRNRQDHK